MKRLAKALGWAAVVALLHAVLFLSSWGEMLEERVLDLWFNLRGPIAPPSEVVVIAMDEDSYGVLGFAPNAPWPRAAHAALLRQLASNGVRKVIFDVLFLGEAALPKDDEELAEALRQVPAVIGAEVVDVDDPTHARKTLQLPLAKFRENATVALVGLPEEYGYVRHFLVPSGLPTHEITGDLPALATAGSSQSREPRPRDLIRFYGPPRTIRTYSYYQAFQSDPPLPPNIFRDKIVFVGLSLQTDFGPSQKDAYLTSFSRRGRMFGVEIHATAAANLVEGKWIRRGSVAAELVSLTIISLLLTLGLFHLRPGWGALAVVGYVTIWAAFAYWFFLRGVLLPGAALAAVVLPVAYSAGTLSNYLSTRLQQLRLQRAFQQYLSPEMARKVAQNPDALRLGGEEVECTALFTDIAGFTTIVERMKPEEVSRMLNAYFTEVMDAVFDKQGTMIQFIGDGVYALWGAPVKTSEHAWLCCQAALAVEAEIERFNQSGRFPPLRTRFGINTGPVLVGNLGSVRRFDFTGIGDTVNLASRLEGLNKYFGTTILLTDTTRDQLPPEVTSLKMGLIRAVGKTLPVGLHTIFREPLSESVTTQWDGACSRFAARNWDSADELFATVGQAEPRLANAASLYRQQIETHRSHSPPPEWQGEIVFKSK